MFAFQLSQETANWLNRIGIILGFFSFWFAAPEFIGEQRLKMWELSLSKLAGKLPVLALITWLSIIFFGIFGISIVFAKRLGLEPFSDESHPDLGPYALLVFAVATVIIIIAFFLPYYYERFIAPFILRVVSGLAEDRQQRQRSLFTGAILFTVSTVLQFVATF